MIIDKLIGKIIETKNPSVIGLDTCVDYLPEAMRAKCRTLDDAANQIAEFNFKLIDKLMHIVPAVKVQVAYYEMYGWQGMKAFADTLKYARANGLITIADVKRNDIGSTAGAYSKAYFSGVELAGRTDIGFESDFITVNGYLGSDGILPFAEDAKKADRGLFVLVKTSNPTSGELQNRILDDGKTIYDTMAGLVSGWGADSVGEYGFSSVGAVVGATHPEEARILREKYPQLFFLIPGYGAQGGSAEGLSVCFNEKGLGGIVNNSRGILCAYKKEQYKGMDFADAAYAAATEMQEDLSRAIWKK